MRKPATIAASLILMISLCAGGIAQTSPSSTPATVSPAASNTPATELTPNQTIAFLLADVHELRAVLESTRAERDEAVAALESEKAHSASLERSYASAEKEIATLNRAIAHLEGAIALHLKTIALVERQRDDAKADARRSRKQAAIATAIAVGLTILRFAF